MISNFFLNIHYMSKTTNPRRSKNVGLRTPEVSKFHHAWLGSHQSNPFWFESRQSVFIPLKGTLTNPLWPNKCCGELVRKADPEMTLFIMSKMSIGEFWRTFSIFPSSMRRCVLKIYTSIARTRNREKWWKNIII